MPPSPPLGRPRLEVADIFRGEAASFLADYGPSLSSSQRRVFSEIQACRTAVLGGHVRACDHCGHVEIAYNSCRNRHCPKCQALACAEWLKQREAELLPIPYFHLVFTLPAEIAALALQNKRVLYGILFEAASQTLRQVAANPRHLGADEIGLLAVLHTWGQNLFHHPHLHCVVSGGGLSPSGTRWIASKTYYFLPVKVLSRVFRNQYRALLEKAFQRGELAFFGELQPLAEPEAFRRFLHTATKREWVVYAKRPFGSPDCVLKYLARYTHRVAISNHRLLGYRDGKVTFRYKDYAHEGQPRTMTLPAAEFIRRFLLHVLPDGFMRIRHYGYLANRHRREKLAICRRLLGGGAPTESPADQEPPVTASCQQGDAAEGTIRCPVCKTGRMRTIETFERLPRRGPGPAKPLPARPPIPLEDSS
ncbi:MAG: IS91 family transposase [Thermoguttaceae bacterium]